MSDTTTTGSLKAVFRFPFEREGWQQVFLIGSGLLFLNFIIPLVPLVFVIGYGNRLMRRAIEGRELVLPKWDDWGALGIDGLRVAGISALYMLPGVIVYGIGIMAYFFMTFSFPFVFAVSDAPNWVTALWPLVLFGSMVVLFVAMFVGGVLFVAGAVPQPMAVAHATAKDSFGAAFRFREWASLLRRNRLGYFVAWVVTTGLSAMAYVVFILLYGSLVLCVLIPLVMAPITFYLALVQAVLFGQVYREATEA